MASNRKTSNQPSCDKSENEYLVRLKSLFAKTVVVPKEQRHKKDLKEQKQLKQNTQIKDEKSVQSVLMKEINNFHEHYGNKISQLRAQIQNLRETVKVLQTQLKQKEMHLSQHQSHIEIVSRENQQLLKMLENDRQQQHKKSDKSDIHTFYLSLNQTYKDKVIIIEKKHAQQLQTMKFKIYQLNKQKQEITKILQKMSSQNSQMRLQIKQYEIEKKYQKERLKNATLELNIKLKSQEEIISKLSRQQSKQPFTRNNSCRLSEIEKRDTMNDSVGGGVLISDPNCQSVLNGSLLDQFKVTNKKISNLGEWRSKQLPMFSNEKDREKERQKQKQSKEKKLKSKELSSNSHKRNLSYHIAAEISPRSQEQKLKTTRDTRVKGNSELKIKVMRLEKMRRK